MSSKSEHTEILQMIRTGTCDNAKVFLRTPKSASSGLEYLVGQKPLTYAICDVESTGLYTAMIFDALEIPNLSYEIIEASSRVGGRAYTHYFSQNKHDYFDVRCNCRLSYSSMAEKRC